MNNSLPALPLSKENLLSKSNSIVEEPEEYTGESEAFDIGLLAAALSATFSLQKDTEADIELKRLHSESERKSDNPEQIRARLRARTAKIPEYYAEAFAYFDLNHDEAIDASELMAVMTSLGLNPAPGDGAKMISHVDENGDGRVDIEEFVNLMTTVGAQQGLQTELEIREAFGVLDTENVGFITALELVNLFAATGERISLEVAGEMVRMVDDDCII